MGMNLDKWTTLVAGGLVIGALLACKKKEEPAPTVTPVPVPTPVASAEPPKVEPPKDEVKRYADKEIAESGTVRIKALLVKVFREADTTTEPTVTLSRGTLVNRKARMGTFLLIDYPSGVGELSPGWVESRLVEDKVVKNVKVEDVAKQDAGTKVVDTTAPKPADADAGKVAEAPKPEPVASVTPPVTPPAPATPDAGRAVRRIPTRLQAP